MSVTVCVTEVGVVEVGVVNRRSAVEARVFVHAHVSNVK